MVLKRFTLILLILAHSLPLAFAYGSKDEAKKNYVASRQAELIQRSKALRLLKFDEAEPPPGFRKTLSNTFNRYISAIEERRRREDLLIQAYKKEKIFKRLFQKDSEIKAERLVRLNLRAEKYMPETYKNDQKLLEESSILWSADKHSGVAKDIQAILMGTLKEELSLSLKYLDQVKKTQMIQEDFKLHTERTAELARLIEEDTSGHSFLGEIARERLREYGEEISNEIQAQAKDAEELKKCEIEEEKIRDQNLQVQRDEARLEKELDVRQAAVVALHEILKSVRHVSPRASDHHKQNGRHRKPLPPPPVASPDEADDSSQDPQLKHKSRGLRAE